MLHTVIDNRSSVLTRDITVKQRTSTYPKTGRTFNAHLLATEAALWLGPVWTQANWRHVDGA